jgi:diguanylate cyclase (GGDEF)-like protein
VPSFLLWNSLIQYGFAVGLAFMLMLILRLFRQRAFLLEKKLLHASRHDSLTGAYSRGYLIELAEREIAYAKRHDHPLAVAMLDIDRFKQINDNYGHRIGDDVIKRLVATCKANLREIDHFGRIGGEEFVCVLPETDESEAMKCAERLRQSIESVRIDTQRGPLQFTVSIGIAMLSPKHMNWNALLNDADIAMYGAKRDGRNRSVLSAAAVQ